MRYVPKSQGLANLVNADKSSDHSSILTHWIVVHVCLKNEVRISSKYKKLRNWPIWLTQMKAETKVNGSIDPLDS